MPTEITLSWWQAGLSVVALLGLAWLSLRPRPAAAGVAEPEVPVEPAATVGEADRVVVGDEQLVLGLIGAFDLATGSEAVRAHVRQVLRGAGVDPVEVDPGADFDPATQEAVDTESVSEPVPGDAGAEADEPRQSGTVARTVRAGWRQGDRMLRPVEVVVWTR